MVIKGIVATVIVAGAILVSTAQANSYSTRPQQVQLMRDLFIDYERGRPQSREMRQAIQRYIYRCNQVAEGLNNGLDNQKTRDFVRDCERVMLGR